MCWMTVLLEVKFCLYACGLSDYIVQGLLMSMFLI